MGGRNASLTKGRALPVLVQFDETAFRVNLAPRQAR